MQNSTVTTEKPLFVPPPPPPPPPPPLPLKSNSSVQDCKCQHAYSKEFKVLKKSPKEDILSAVRHITYQFYVENPSDLISVYYPISPVIQEGRCCGIVALSMATQLFNNMVSSDDILSLAKSLNFTKEGEMFSVYNMAELAKNLLHCNTILIDNLDVHKEDMLNHICDGSPLLIPYDADKNHFPCSNNGITAHWAVISGLAFTITDKKYLSALTNYEILKEYPELNIFLIKDIICIKEILKYSDQIFLYAHQGKSKHLAAWDLNDLLESNKNMHQVTKKYDSDELILPIGDDALCELRNKAVVLKKDGLVNSF